MRSPLNDALNRKWSEASATLEKLERELAEARADLQFVERWANHHGAKPSCTAEEALSVIQHYPPIKAITESYEDGKVPDTRNPWAELATVTAECERLRNENSLMAAHQGIDNYQRVIGRAEKAEAECERLRRVRRTILKEIGE